MHSHADQQSERQTARPLESARLWKYIAPGADQFIEGFQQIHSSSSRFAVASDLSVDDSHNSLCQRLTSGYRKISFRDACALRVRSIRPRPWVRPTLTQLAARLQVPL